MNTSLEARKTFDTERAVPDKTKSTDRICTRVPWFDDELNRKTALEAEHKRTDAITVLCHLIGIR